MATDQDEAKQRQMLKETGSRRRHHYPSQPTSAQWTSSSTSSSSSTPTTAAPARSTAPLYPTLTASDTFTTADSQQKSGDDSKGQQPSSSAQWYGGAPIAQPVRPSPSPPPPAYSSIFPASAPDDDDSKYVIIDDDDDALRAELANSRQARAAPNPVFPTSTSSSALLPRARAASPANTAAPLSSVDADEQYARELVERDKRMEEDEKLAKQIHQQQLYDAEHDPYTGQQHRHHQHPSSSSFSSFPHFSAATPGQSATSATAIPFPFSSLMASHFSMDENDPRSRALRLIQLRSVLAGMPMDPSQLHMLLGAQRTGRRGMGGGGGLGGTGGSVPTSGPSGDFPLDEYGIPDPEQMEYQQLLEFCDALGEVKQRGLDAQQLSLLPTYHWKPSRKGRAAGGSRWKDDGDEKRVAAAADVRLDDEQCSICLTPYEEGEEIKRLPCLHVFHSDCVDPWSAATTALAAVDPLQPQSPRSAHRIALSCCCRSASRLSGWLKTRSAQSAADRLQSSPGTSRATLS